MSAKSAAGAQGHPDPETLSAFVDGSLPESDKNGVVEHLAHCEECLELVTEVMQEQAPVVAAAVPRYRWAVAVAAIAATALLAFLMRGPLSPTTTVSDAALSDLVAAVGATEALPARLTGGFIYEPTQGAMRSGAARDNLSLTAAAGALQQAADDTPSAETLHRWGAAALLLQRFDEAERALTAAAALQDGNARMWSDVGAAYVVRAEATGRADDWPRAVSAIERALRLDPAMPEALFNRAKAITALNLRSEAIKAWEAYLQADSSSAWAVEARRQLARLNQAPVGSRWPEDRQQLLTAAASGAGAEVARLIPPYAQQVREWVEDRLLPEWGRAYGAGNAKAAVMQRQVRALALALRDYSGDRLLADTSAALDRDVRQGNGARLENASAAFALYGAAREAYEATKIGEATSLFRQADQRFAATDQPMRLWSQLHIVIGDYYAGKIREAHEAAERLGARADQHSYTALAGRAYWMAGLTDTMRARHDDQLRAYATALARFERSREPSNAAAIHNLLAAAAQNIGDRRQTWTHLMAALTDVGPLTPPRRRHTQLVNVATRALRWGNPELALIATAEALTHARAWGAPEGLLEAHLYRARAFAAAGDTELSVDEAAAARSHLAQLNDDVIRARFQAELDGMDAEVFASVDAARALAAGRSAIDFFSTRSSPLRVPRLRLLEGKTLRRSGDLTAAAAAFEAGIDAFERERKFVPKQTATRVSHIDDAWELYRQLGEVTAARGASDERLLDVAERGRARSLGEQIEAPATENWPQQVLARLPPNHAVIYFVRVDDGFLGIVLARGAIHRHALNTTPSIVEHQVRQLELALTGPSAGDAWKGAGQALYTALIKPLGLANHNVEAVTFVPDGPIARVPFAALADDATGRALIEDFDIAIVPSAAFLLTALERHSQFDQSTRVLSIANSKEIEAEDLRALPGAAQEVEAIAQLFPNGRTLIDREATVDNVRARVAGASVLHFAGHTIANLEYPELSRLFLSDGADGAAAVFAEDLRTLDVAGLRLVVLASCKGLSEGQSSSEAILGIARGFLTAGVPNVVASRWEVADASASRMMRQFYAELARGTPARTALAVAARHAMRSREPPRAWAAWVYIGA
jgi:CHAT domain-containing protein